MDPAKAALGRSLFHEPLLSKDGSISCASCHDLREGGDDGRRVSIGIEGQAGTINAPTVFNVGLNFAQFWDGRARTLEQQVDEPVQSPIEMGSLWPEVVAKLAGHPDYPGHFQAIYPDGINRKNIKDALAQFMRSLITPNSRFDQWLRGDEAALSAEERHGYELFKSYGCVSCHQGANVGGNMFQVFGVLNEYFKRRGNITEADLGRYNVTGNVCGPPLLQGAESAHGGADGAVPARRQRVDAALCGGRDVRVSVGARGARRGQRGDRRVHPDAGGRIRGAFTMRAQALWVGIVVSVLLLGAAGVLYVRASGGAEAQYRDAIALVREIQQLSSQWSVEVARVKSDPLADFDALSGFIPRMGRLKAGLRERSRGIGDLPERVVSDVNVYLSALDAKEERVERFKTGYAVVRNSTRYLPLAAANVTRQAQEAGEEALARSVAVLVQDMNLYLSNPTQTAGTRLGEELQRLREASVSHPPALANGLANLVSHAEVLLERQGPTEELFAGATSGDIAELTERVVGAFEFELGKQAVQSAWYERALLGVIAALALFWVALAVQQRVRGGAEPRSAAPAPSAEAPDSLDAAAAAEALADDEAGDLRVAMLTATAPEPEPGEPAAARALLDPAPSTGRALR